MEIDLTTLKVAWAWMRARAHLAGNDEHGQAALEYVIIAALISVAVVALVVYIITQIDSSKSRIQTQ